MTEEVAKVESLSILKRQRGTVKGSITRIKNMLESSTAEWDSNILQCRIELLTSYMDQVMSYQSQIELIDTEDNKRAELEELCISVKAKLMSLISKNKRRESSVLDSTLGITIPPSSRLPNLKLPSFGGKYCDYKNFISSFYNLVHEEPTLSPIEKFNHLLSCLTGDALRTVKAFQVTEDNYPKVLARLEERYDKKSLIFFDNIENLFDIPKMISADASSLRNVVDTVSAIFGSLQSLGSHTEILNAVIIHLVLSRVDNDTKAKWNEQLDYSVLPSWEDCAKMLIRRSQSLEVNENRSSRNERSFNKKDKKQRNGKVVFSCTQLSNDKLCLYCKASKHHIQDCSTFSSISVSERFDFAKRNSCCLNCLKVGHGVARCKSPRCKICNKPHHSLLHRYTTSSQIGDSGLSSLANASPEAISHRTVMHMLDNSTVILATAVVEVLDRFGNFQLVRTLLDSGSQLNLITEECARRLHLRLEPNHKNLCGVGTVNLQSNHKVNATIKSRINSFEFQDEFSVLETICSYQPEFNLSGIESKIPKNLVLADPNFNKCQKVDMLIGTDVFFEILSVGQIKLGNSLPKLQKTLLGWIVAGKSRNMETSNKAACNMINSNESVNMENLEHFVHKFWELEELPNRLNKYTEEHSECEAHYRKNVKILTSGRFEVKLPFKESSVVLGKSLEIAKRRFLSLERRLSKTPEIKTLYNDFMKEYISLGHMSEATNLPTFPHYVIPHQCVLRPDSVSTKLRVVFDASCRTSTQVSLNEILMVGPTIQPDLYRTLLRFRCFKYAMTADITKMYRQVMVNQIDRKYQMILWRETEDLPIKMFSLNTVTYGTAPAPFLAIRCLKELSNIFKEKYPIGSHIVENHFYVDDMLTGADTLPELERIKGEVGTVLKSAGFELAKWHCNNKEFVTDHIIGKELVLNEIDHTKTLGMTWFSREDIFQFKIDFDFANLKATKRNILSLSARLFDPLGLLSPIILQSKVILQELWREKLDWDESVPMAIESSWQLFKATLKDISMIKIPRYTNTLLDRKVQIHGFADSSEIAYGCCLYTRAIVKNKVVVSLLTAKSKVAPLKKRSLPRLELSAAHMLSKLWKAVENVMLPYTEKVYFWSDSEIVLYWLKKYPSTLSTFVGNRVADIQEWSPGIIWKHVPTNYNPADIVSRGCSVDELQKSIWFSGPTFLSLSDDMWPINSNFEPSDEEKYSEKK